MSKWSSVKLNNLPKVVADHRRQMWDINCCHFDCKVRAVKHYVNCSTAHRCGAVFLSVSIHWVRSAQHCATDEWKSNSEQERLSPCWLCLHSSREDNETSENSVMAAMMVSAEVVRDHRENISFRRKHRASLVAQWLRPYFQCRGP